MDINEYDEELSDLSMDQALIDDNGNAFWEFWLMSMLPLNEFANGAFEASLNEALDYDAPLEVFRSILDTWPPEATRHGQLAPFIHKALCRLHKHPIPTTIVRFLIEHDPECARKKFANDRWLLHEACSSNAPLEIIELLLEIHPEAIGASCRCGMYPLHSACLGEVPLATIELLLDRFPEIIRLTDNKGNLPLHLACRGGASLEVVKLLIDRYPDGVRMKNDNGCIPLHQLCVDTSLSLDVMKFLIESYPQGVWAQNCYSGWLPLHAVCAGHQELEVIQLLIRHYRRGARVRTFDGQFPIHLACYHSDNVEVPTFLLDTFPEGIRAKDTNGSLPLHNACDGESSPDLVQLLVETYPESLCIPDEQGRLPLHAASVGSSILTKRHCVPPTMLQFLIDRFPKAVYVADTQGYLPLHLACLESHSLEHVKVLVQADPITLLQKTKDGKTALKLAFESECSSFKIMSFVQDYEDTALEYLREVFEEVIVEHIGFPDLIVAKIWKYLYPDLWTPSQEDWETSLQLPSSY